MVSNRDLLLGVERGIISQEQLARLVSIASDVREKGPAETLQQQDALREADDEAPRFIRSFGDLFIAIGTGFLGAGLMSAVTFLGDTLPAQLGALVIIWLTAEWLTGYLRISAPSIVLSLLFTGFAAYYLQIIFSNAVMENFDIRAEYEPIFIGAPAMLAAGLFYLRFRLPFALAIFGLTVVGLVIATVGTISSDFLLSNFRWIIGLGGLNLFGAAMWFDLQDPSRTSRRSDCGFWLHLIAAPMLTHSVLWNSNPAVSNIQKMLGMDPALTSWVVITVFFVLFGIVALIINRRALLVSSLGYVGGVIAYGIWNLNLSAGASTTVVLLIIALLILSFGVGWKPLRRLVFMALPPGKYLNNLPPALG